MQLSNRSGGVKRIKNCYNQLVSRSLYDRGHTTVSARAETDLEIAGKATYIFHAHHKFIFKQLVKADWGHPARFLQIRNINIEK